MKTSFIGLVVLLSLSPAVIRAEEPAQEGPVWTLPEATESRDPTFWGKALGVVTTVNHYIENYVEIGFRSTHFTLVDNKKGTAEDGRGFLGSINELEEEQDYSPYPYFRVFPIPRFHYIGVEIGYDRVRAITRKWTDPPPGGSEDEDIDVSIDLRGPSFQLVARYHNWKWLVPYISAGYVFYRADFEHEEWWHMGFGSYLDPEYIAWVRSGRQGDPNGGYRRTIEVEDTTGTIVAGGLSARLWKGVQIEADVRYIPADVDASYTQSWPRAVRPQGDDYKFPMSTWGYRIGLKYLF